jgi:hypothetical protein
MFVASNSLIIRFQLAELNAFFMSTVTRTHGFLVFSVFSCPLLEYHFSFLVILMLGSATNTLSISMSTAVCLSRSCAARLLFRFICIVFIGFMISKCTSFLSDCKSSASFGGGLFLFAPAPEAENRGTSASETIQL